MTFPSVDAVMDGHFWTPLMGDKVIANCTAYQKGWSLLECPPDLVRRGLYCPPGPPLFPLLLLSNHYHLAPLDLFPSQVKLSTYSPDANLALLRIYSIQPDSPHARVLTAQVRLGGCRSWTLMASGRPPPAAFRS